MREQICSIIESQRNKRRSGVCYDWFIMAVAILSVVPMMFRGELSPIMQGLESLTVYILFFDYILRWITNDYRMKNRSIWAFFVYPFTPLALMDIAGILPTLGLLPPSFMILRILRLVKLAQYSQSCRRIMNVFRQQSKTLCSVLIIAVAYIFISALVMFVHEPADNFPTFFDALYWATTALTTVGYGDIYPATQIGRIISMVSSLLGIAVIAMPAGIVTAGFMEELNKDLAEKEQKEKEEMEEKEKQNGAEKEGKSDEK